jgi:uncharacterized protein involved in exopolysaccharide biosynthesis
MTAATPRDKFDRLLQYVHRARRYWWLVVGLVVIGGALAVAFAVSTPLVFQSGTVLYYQERIQTSLLQNRDVSTLHRNIGERYRELLLARSSLVEVIRNPKLNPFPELVAAEGEESAVEELRLKIKFVPRGANTFVITYQDSQPGRAKDVLEELTRLLKAKEASNRLQSAEETANFAASLRKEAVEDLRAKQSVLNTFLVKNPEFAIDAAEGQGEGASIRMAQKGDGSRPKTAAEGTLQALERQRARIKARLANPSAPPSPQESRAARPRTPDQIAADGRVAEAKRVVAGAESQLEAERGRWTDKHPNVIRAMEAVSAAKKHLAEVKAAVPADDEDLPELALPTGPVDPKELEKQLANVERLLSAAKARGGSAPAPEAGTVNQGSWVVKLEDDYQALRLEVDEQRLSVQRLTESAFRSQLEAQQRVAEQGASLSVVDPAYRPLKPVGKGKKVVVIAGVMLFGILGAALALALAIIDDRIYRRADLDVLGLAPVLAVIPRARARSKRRLKDGKK